MKTIGVYLVSSLVPLSCAMTSNVPSDEIQIAFIADAHLHDIKGAFSDTDYRGIRNPRTGENNVIRTMEAQLHSTRLFNENYFALEAALNDIVARGIKIVALPGDLSDDGQALNLRALNRILGKYSKNHGISFFAITGNHDPLRPYRMEAGKPDFLGKEGEEQSIISDKDVSGMSADEDPKPIVTRDIAASGYEGVLTELKDFGFFPKKDYLYWATPFSDYTLESYSFEKALRASAIGKRRYPYPTQGVQMPDASYLVEPTEGLWLLALDGNVYPPKSESGRPVHDPHHYGSASIGYSNVLDYKKHLIPWVRRVAAEARKHRKTLITFSHYPMVEFNDGISAQMAAFFGDRKMQLHRVPTEEVAKRFADAGIVLHFGGHMHINDTGVYTTEKGNTLVNVQVPSLATYPAAYKILGLRPGEPAQVGTVRLDSVPGFDSLFDLYKLEYERSVRIKGTPPWNKEILKAGTYREFTMWHLRELVRLRFLPDDWPQGFDNEFLEATGKELLLKNTGPAEHAEVSARLSEAGFGPTDLESWNGFDLIFDFYRLRNADRLALDDIGNKRIRQYKLVLDGLSVKKDASSGMGFRDFASIFKGTLNGSPAIRFKVDLSTGKVENEVK